MWLLLVVVAPLVLVLVLVLLRRRGCSTSMRGQHVLVTGGSSGMGLAAAVCAARRGASVTLVARDAARLERARTAVQSAGACDVLAVSCDVAGDADAVRDAILRAERQLGPVHVLLCCAGFAVAQRADLMPLSEHRRLMDVNYFGTLQVLHATLPLMRARRRGRVCLVSSIGGLVGLWGFSSYCGSKFALVGLAQVLMQELRPYGVSVTIGLPPDTDTPGFAEENRSKPAETRLVSESAGLVSAEVMGARLLDDTLAGRVSSTVGVEGWMMAALGLAVAPVDSWRRLVLQVGLLGPLRLVMAGVHRGWDAAIQRCADQNDSDKQL